jgi:hypothetical protein
MADLALDPAKLRAAYTAALDQLGACWLEIAALQQQADDKCREAVAIEQRVHAIGRALDALPDEDEAPDGQ